jgi:hypothetical protein
VLPERFHPLLNAGPTTERFPVSAWETIPAKGDSTAG